MDLAVFSARGIVGGQQAPRGGHAPVYLLVRQPEHGVPAPGVSSGARPSAVVERSPLGRGRVVEDRASRDRKQREPEFEPGWADRKWSHPHYEDVLLRRVADLHVSAAARRREHDGECADESEVQSQFAHGAKPFRRARGRTPLRVGAGPCLARVADDDRQHTSATYRPAQPTRVRTSSSIVSRAGLHEPWSCRVAHGGLVHPSSTAAARDDLGTRPLSGTRIAGGGCRRHE
jgi:hypothetical protein